MSLFLVGLVLFALSFGLLFSPLFVRLPSSFAFGEHLIQSEEQAGEWSHPKVLLFYDLDKPDCSSCDLHLWRMAYYFFQFEKAGARVFGVVQGLRNGSAQRDESLHFPWPVVYDLSGRVARFYGVEGAATTQPTVVVLDGQGRLLLRLQPSETEDRIEADVLTTIIAASRRDPLDVKVSVATELK